MPKIAAPSAFDVAYWFLQFAEKKQIFIEDEKLHHLLFLSQLIYMQRHGNEILFPSMFIATKKGFLEPNLLKVFAQGHPFMPNIKIDEKISVFLEQIWDKYGNLPLLDLRSTVTQSQAFKSCYDEKNLIAVDMKQIADLFKLDKEQAPQSRIRMSQHGPVMVSQWSPRKVNKKD